VKSLKRLLARELNHHSALCQVFDLEDKFVKEEHIQISPVQRSIDENISAFGRTAVFPYNTVVKSGYIIKNTAENEEYFISSWRAVSLCSSPAAFSAFLLQINATGDIYRNEELDFNPDTGEVKTGYVKKISGLKLYVQKKDWTMEMMTAYGREQKGYETIICQERDIRQGDRIQCPDKKYIVQDINRTLRDNMLSLQVGVNIKHIEE
jgi:hypothetical protein